MVSWAVVVQIFLTNSTLRSTYAQLLTRFLIAMAIVFDIYSEVDPAASCDVCSAIR